MTQKSQFLSAKMAHFVIRKPIRKFGSEYGIDWVSISCTRRVLKVMQNKLPTMAFDSPRFITDELSQAELWPIKIHEGRRRLISPEFAMKTSQSHTQLKQLV